MRITGSTVVARKSGTESRKPSTISNPNQTPQLQEQQHNTRPHLTLSPKPSILKNKREKEPLIMLSLLTWVVFAMMMGETAIRNKRNKAVKGSHQRYILSTWRTIIGASTALGAFLVATILYTTGDTIGGIMMTAGFAATIFFEIIIRINEDNNEDNWFNGRGKKIWNSIKKTIRSLQPKPITAVAGAGA